MTAELTYVALVILLAVVQIFLPATARTRQFGTKWNASPRDEPTPAVKPVTGRLERAQANLYETLPLFIGAVLVAHVAGEDGFLTYWGATVYFWSRVVYVPLYAFGVTGFRSLAFLASLVGLLMIVAALFL
jgi:uncharacterized MAPEG superfamily protein